MMLLWLKWKLGLFGEWVLCKHEGPRFIFRIQEEKLFSVAGTCNTRAGKADHWNPLAGQLKACWIPGQSEILSKDVGLTLLYSDSVREAIPVQAYPVPSKYLCKLKKKIFMEFKFFHHIHFFHKTWLLFIKMKPCQQCWPRYQILSVHSNSKCITHRKHLKPWI